MRKHEYCVRYKIMYISILRRVSFSFCVRSPKTDPDFETSFFGEYARIKLDFIRPLMLAPDIRWNVSEIAEKRTTNTGLLARPHPIRETRLNVFIRSNEGRTQGISFESGGMRGIPNPFRKQTNNFGFPPRDFTIDIYERSNVPKWKFTRPIMRSIMSFLVLGSW